MTNAPITTTVPAGTWTVDPAHSSVEFRVKHLGIATVKGRFERFNGELTVTEDGAHQAHGTVDVHSITTHEPKRDEHLRSPDFFDAAAYPQIAFASTALAVDGDELRVTGDITIHGVTQPIELTGELGGVEQDPWGNERVGLQLRGQLNRSAFGMTFNQALGSGNVVVGDKVRLEIEVSAVKAG